MAFDQPPRTLRCITISCCLSAAFSASSRLADLNGEASSLKRKHSSAIIVADDRRFHHRIKTDEVFQYTQGGIILLTATEARRSPRRFPFQDACPAYQARKESGARELPLIRRSINICSASVCKLERRMAALFSSVLLWRTWQLGLPFALLHAS